MMHGHLNVKNVSGYIHSQVALLQEKENRFP